MNNPRTIRVRVIEDNKGELHAVTDGPQFRYDTKNWVRTIGFTLLSVDALTSGAQPHNGHFELRTT